MAWLRCFDTKGNTVYLNFDNVVSFVDVIKGGDMQARPGKGRTKLSFVGTAKTLIVAQTKEAIAKALNATLVN